MFFKIMWTNKKQVLWYIRKGHSLELTHNVYNIVEEELDINKWKKDYSLLYFNWLYDDNPCIYDIHSEINMRIISSLPKINTVHKDHNQRLYYWFDVVRNIDLSYKWTNCPLTGNTLKRMRGYDDVLFSEESFLVLPDTL